MCGRFTQTGETEKLVPRFNVAEVREAVTPRFNVAPSQKIPVVVNDGGRRVLDAIVWGLVPAWTKELKKAMKPINAKSETVATSGMFKRLLTGRRCLVPADSFYEWMAPPANENEDAAAPAEPKAKGKKALAPRKQPMRMTLKSGEHFAFAGLWDSWKDPETNEELRTCVILTTSANDLVRRIHDRMPVILPRDAEERWLDPELKEAEALCALLKPFPAELMDARPVSHRVNNARYDGPDCITGPSDGPTGPVTPEQIGLFPKS